MKIRKAHILARHFHNMEDDSAGIFYTKVQVLDTVSIFIPQCQWVYIYIYIQRLKNE
jgi:hypothetical protein